MKPTESLHTGELKRILLIGKRKTVLIALAQQLHAQGFAAEWTNSMSKVMPEIFGHDFDVVAFGRGVTDESKAAIQNAFSRQHEGVRFITGLAPITELLVYQIRQALQQTAIHESPLKAFTIGTSKEHSLKLEVSKACEVELILFSFDVFFRKKRMLLFNEMVAAGQHEINTKQKRSWLGQDFIVVKADGTVAAIEKC